MSVFGMVGKTMIGKTFPTREFHKLLDVSELY